MLLAGLDNDLEPLAGHCCVFGKGRGRQLQVLAIAKDHASALAILRKYVRRG